RHRAIPGIVAVALLAPLAALRPAATQATRPDYTFHITLTPPATPLQSWTVSGTPATPITRSGAEIVDGDATGPLPTPPPGTPATVAAWTPAQTHLDLTLYFRNVGTANATASTLVVDMISPAWDMTLSPSGGFVRGTATYTSAGNQFGEHIAAGAMPAGAT